MQYFDCFNGDADGICALTQMRLLEPQDSKLITGVKRDIKLLDQVDANAGDQVTVLDISLDKNRDALDSVLKKGASVFYCDHHFAGDIPSNERLTTVINTSADVCTSLLINQAVTKGEFLGWAVVGTFGDNLRKSAQGLAKGLACSQEQLALLESLGIYMNYNGYGASLDDLYFTPDALYRKVKQFSSPFDFIAQDRETFATLENGYHEDMAKAARADEIYRTEQAAVITLPDQSWARRVGGVYGNELANQHPSRAHAVVTVKANGNYLVSVRAPLNNKQGAVEICRQFATGGGRAAAAGINDLPADQLPSFIDTLSKYYA